MGRDHPLAGAARDKGRPLSGPTNLANLPEMIAEPYRFDFLATMRRLERSRPDLPRIGDSAASDDDIVRLGQNPYMDFPASNLSKVEAPSNGRLRIILKFLGLLGPQGALPLATTEEAFLWLQRDDSFARFLDLLNNRFLQLFFRSWADSRPIAQHDRPADDRFRTYVGVTIGIGSSTLMDLDTVPDAGKLSFAGLLGPQTKSASRLRSAIAGLFGVRVEIEQFVGSRLAMEADEQTRLGARNSSLGGDVIVGGNCFTVEDKFRIRIYVRDMAQYHRFLPPGDRCEPLADLVTFYVGEALDFDIELALPVAAIEPMKLGSFASIGWTSWLAPDRSDPDAYRCDAQFNPSDILRQKRQRRAERAEGAPA